MSKKVPFSTVDQLQVSKFRQWLEAQSPRSRFHGYSNCCPIARWIGSPSVGLVTMKLPGQLRRRYSPGWVVKFVALFDRKIVESKHKSLSRDQTHAVLLEACYRRA